MPAPKGAIVLTARGPHDEVPHDRLAALRADARVYELAQRAGVLERRLDTVQQRLR